MHSGGRGFDSHPVHHMKKFFTMQLKGYNENVPIELAKDLLVKESPFVKYLSDNGALKVRHMKSRATMECYADEKHLMIAKLKFGKVLPGRIGFIELFIRNQLSRKLGAGPPY